MEQPELKLYNKFISQNKWQEAADTLKTLDYTSW